MDILNFFYTTIPPEGVLSLEELHLIVRDIWLRRHDEELEIEKAARRKGRPKSTREQKLEETMLREEEVYRTGMGESLALLPEKFSIHALLEIPDLTHEVNVQLFREWDQKEAGYLQLLRFIRISGTTSDTAAVSRSGTHPMLMSKPTKTSEPHSPDQDMIIESVDV